ncbi:hypothetical protein HMPREF3193_00453 [Bifidobacterium breve]|nr:hypothetical protein HMPREF1587_01720 [Bifidobacterium breve JCP7499]KWZ86273.1 hypothetical protein HMPREF3193_00453 [Bifidobacterium breve]
MRCCPTRLWDNISINRLTVRLSQHKKIRIVGIPPFLRLCHIRPQLWEWDNSQKSAYFSSCPTVFGFVAADSSPSARASPVFFVFTAPFDAAS